VAEAASAEAEDASLDAQIIPDLGVPVQSEILVIGNAFNKMYLIATAENQVVIGFQFLKPITTQNQGNVTFSVQNGLI
jgi:hypothetical protein